MRLPLDIERQVTAGEPRYRDHDLTHVWETNPVQSYRKSMSQANTARWRVARIDRQRRQIDQQHDQHGRLRVHRLEDL